MGELEGTTGQEPIAEAGAGQGTPNAGATSFTQLARESLEADDQNGGDGDAATAAAGESVDAGTDGAEGGSGDGDGDGASGEEILDSLADLDPESIPENLRPLYDDLMERRRLMQTDYVRKTQQLADGRRAVEQERTEFDSRVQAAVQEELAKHGVAALRPEPQQQAQAGPTLEQLAYDLGPLVTLEQIAKSDDPEVFQRYVQQQATIEARRAVSDAMAQVVMPQIGQVASTVTAQQQEAAMQRLSKFNADNPDLVEHIDKVLGLLEAGIAKDLDEAAAATRKVLFGDQQVQQAFELGTQAATARAQKIETNKEKFDVPAGSTAPGATAKPDPSMSFRDLARQAISGMSD